MRVVLQLGLLIRLLGLRSLVEEALAHLLIMIALSSNTLPSGLLDLVEVRGRQVILNPNSFSWSNDDATILVLDISPGVLIQMQRVNWVPRLVRTLVRVLSVHGHRLDVIVLSLGAHDLVDGQRFDALAAGLLVVDELPDVLNLLLLHVVVQNVVLVLLLHAAQV